MLIHANASFYALYTTRGQLLIFNSRTTQLIKSGLLLPNVCMLAGFATSMKLLTLTMRGLLQVYRVKAQMALDSCALDHQVSVVELCGSKEQLIESIGILHDDTIVVTMSNLNKFMYDSSARCWRELPGSVQLQSQDPHRPVVKIGQG